MYHKKQYLCIAFQNDGGFRAFSSAGSEHLPYKQRVGGSNPSTPTKRKTKPSSEVQKKEFSYFRAFSSAGSEHLPYKQRVGGSNPSTPTTESTFWWTFFVVGVVYLLRKYSSKVDISCSLVIIFEASFEDTFARSKKYSSELDISCSLIRIFDVV